MVEAANQRHRVLVDVGKVDHPAARGVDLALDDHVDLIAVAVHARALVPRRDMRQKMRRFESITPFQLRPHLSPLSMVGRTRE